MPLSLPAFTVAAALRNQQGCAARTWCGLRRQRRGQAAVGGVMCTGSLHINAQHCCHVPSTDDEASLDAFVKASDALYAAEARGCGVTVDEGSHATAQLTAAKGDSARAILETAHADDIMTLLMDPADTVMEPPSSPASPAGRQASSALVTLGVAAEQSAAAALVALLAVNPQTQRAPSLAAAASELLTTGLDVKAVLAGRPLEGIHLSHQSLRQCDLSLTQLRHITCEGCDFRRSLFYGSQLSHAVFRRCRFDGAVLRKLECDGEVLFEDCQFCFADVGLLAPPSMRGAVKGTGRRGDADHSGLTFLRCDFDLSTFEGSRGLNNPRMFVDCRNTHTALRFPLRVQRRV